jgi:hypothetical protein
MRWTRGCGSDVGVCHLEGGSELDLRFKRVPNPSLVLKREVTSGAIRGVTVQEG